MEVCRTIIAKAAGPARIGAAALAGAALAMVANAQEELVFPLDEAPETALEVARAAAPDVTFEAVDVEVEDGVITLEFVGTHADGHTVEVDVAQGWTVLEVEDVIALEEVPEAVMEALKLQMGEFEPTEVERSRRGDAVVYEFEGADADGRAVDIEVQSEGESIIVLDDEDT